MKNYDDMIDLPHHVSKTRPQMTRENRAAQFAPFAALTGHDSAIKETARLTSEKIVLDDEQIKLLNRKLSYIGEKTDEHRAVTVTHFVADKRKKGGAYVTTEGKVKNIDEYEGILELTDRTKIKISDIVFIEISNK